MMPGRVFGSPWLFIEDVLVVEGYLRGLHEACGESCSRRIEYKVLELLNPHPVAVVVEVSALALAALDVGVIKWMVVMKTGWQG